VANETIALLGSSLLIDVLHNDGGVGLTLTGVSPALKGTTRLESGQIRCTAPAEVADLGDDLFSYTVTDRNGATSSASVAVQVVEVLPAAYLPAAFGLPR
jgi:hypothetical protein